MELTEREQTLITTLRATPEMYQDGFMLIHFSPVNDTHIVRHLTAKPASLGALSRGFYTAFLELKRWLKLPQATFLLHFEEDMCRVFSFSRQEAVD